MRTIIYLSGFAGSGKDTGAEALIKQLEFTRYAFADILKDYVAQKYGLDREALDTQNFKASIAPVNILGAESVRELLIREANLHRSLDIDFYAKGVAQKICDTGDDLIVISDWRFPNEYMHLKHVFNTDTKHITVNIVRKVVKVIDDPSEKALTNWPFDIRILNDDKEFFSEHLVRIISECLEI